jgi:Tol biopolymer transport system component
MALKFLRPGLRILALIVPAFVLASSGGDRTLNSGGPDGPAKDSTKKDTARFSKYVGLPLKPARKISYTTHAGTWMSVDISPDGQTLVFDLVGDLYTMPVGGGKATRVTRGIAFDTHPRYSPDGRRILFTSDRSGAENIWYIDLDKQDTVQLTKDRDQNFPSAAWTPDGQYIVYSKGRLNVQLYMMHKDGGSGTQLISTPAGLKTIDAAVSADGRYIYYSRRFGPWNYNAQLPQYQLGQYDRETGKMNTITSRYGSAFTPVLSKDGKWMVYGSRHEDKTGLVLRNLATGDEKWLAYPVQRDDQESIAVMGVLPGMTFTPDSKAVIASYGGKFHRIPVDGTAITDIAIDADLDLELGPRLEFKYKVSDSSHALATQIRDAVPSPDGKKLAFTVLNRLYVMDYPNGTPHRLTTNEYTEAEPVWYPDGTAILYTTWSPEGGALYKVNLAGKATAPVKLTTESALYQQMAFNNDGTRIVFIHSHQQAFKNAIGPDVNGNEDEIDWIPANGGAMTVIDKALGRYNPHFVKGDNRIYLNNGSGSLVSVNWEGADEKTLATVSGITTFGMMNYKNGRPDPAMMQCIMTEASAAAQEMNLPSTASFVTLSPKGNRALALINNDVYLVSVPKTGKTNVINVGDPASASYPARKLTELGGEFPSWEADGKSVHWSLGNSHFVYDVDRAQAFDDSLKQAKKDEARHIADSTERVNSDSTLKKAAEAAKKTADSVKKVTDSIAAAKDPTKKEAKKKEDPTYKATETEVRVYFRQDIPQGFVLLKGGRVVTMKGEEVIENGDVLVENNRIRAVGRAGTLTVPAGAKVIDVTGKTVTPGFVDPHAHMWPVWGIHKNQMWMYATNLAYGVTTTRDPQTGTTDVLTYGDMVTAGMMVGPRIYSTGPGVGYWDYNIKDSAQAELVLKQYSKYYNTHYIKMYLTGNRQQRQWIIMAANNQQLMPTTEGGLNYKLNLTNLLDGYPGHEHAIPIYPLQEDVIKAIAEAKMCVTPTLLVSYGGPFAENYFWETEDAYHDKKMQYFMPYEELAGKTRRVGGWFMKEEQVFPKHAKNMKALVEAGGLAGIGSHGEFQGLGYHWEMWAMQSGGMRNIDVLRTATILGATGLGLDRELGSIETGKLADILIMDKNPLEDIRNTNTLSQVMKNGRLYDANTADQVYPKQVKLDRKEWQSDAPVSNTGVKE